MKDSNKRKRGNIKNMKRNCIWKGKEKKVES